MKSPKCIPNYKYNLVCPDNYLKKRDVNVIKDVPDVVMTGEANFLYYLNRKEGRLKQY